MRGELNSVQPLMAERKVAQFAVCKLSRKRKMCCLRTLGPARRLNLTTEEFPGVDEAWFCVFGCTPTLEQV